MYLSKNGKAYKYKNIVFFFACVSFFYVLNVFTPLCFGDDYVYSFVWEGHSMFEPMSEQVRRLSSFRDLLVSQWSHYLTGNGRAVSHTIAQFFLWMGKDIFNMFNTLVSVLLVIEIYWCANKGKVIFNFQTGRLVFIFFALWAFTPSFPSVFLWLSGACNYLWTAVFLLGFLLPYVHKYYFYEERLVDNNWFKSVMFFCGVIAGWTNENSVCWIILLLFVFIYANRKQKGFESWMFAGIVGMLVGYAYMMFAPGNMVRLSVQTKENGWLTMEKMQEHVALLFLLSVYFHIFLWYFNLRSFFYLRKKEKEDAVLSKDVMLVRTICIASFCMTFMMLFSPNFQTRSTFPGTVLLIIAAAILLRVQNDYSIVLINKLTKKFLCIVGTVFFVITTVSTFYGSYYYHEQVKQLVSFVQSSEDAQRNTIVVNTIQPVHHLIYKSSYFHLIYSNLSPNENDWANVAFARYYGIKGISMVEKKSVQNK